MRTSLCVVLLFVASHAAPVVAETPSNSKLSDSEQELVTLMTDFRSANETYWSKLREYKSNQAYKEAVADGIIVDPCAKYVPKLLKFEAEHHGEDVGLLAMWHVFKEAARGGRSDDPANVGRRDAVTKLAVYANSELLPFVASTAMLGHFDLKVYQSVTELVRTQVLPNRGRDILRYKLAAKCFAIRDLRAGCEKRLKSLRSGVEPSRPDELEFLLTLLAPLPPTEELEQQYQAARETLEELSSSENSPRLGGLDRVDEKAFLVRFIEDPARPLLAEMAAAALFKELHLTVGAPAPDINVRLLDDTLWRMADQRGKVVIVQFSFTGCGPCERMYRDLASLYAEFGDELAILTLMRDKTSKNALDAVESGKISWSVAIDGNPGAVTTKWSVSSFPETYVIDRDGKIAAQDPGGKRLRKEVVRLLEKSS